MKREEKSNLISALQSSLKEANGVFVVENHGLSVREFEGLRNELRPLVSVFKVVKNRLTSDRRCRCNRRIGRDQGFG